MKLLSLAWTVVAALLVAHQVQLWRGGLPVETDLLALLPRDQRDPAADAVLRHLGDAAGRSVVLLVSAPTRPGAQAAAAAVDAALDSPALERAALASPGPALLEALAPWREYLLTPAQERRLAGAAPGELVQRALFQLHQPVGGRLLDVAVDPLQLYREYWTEQAQRTRLRPDGEHLAVATPEGHHVLLRYRTTRGAFSFDGVAHLEAAIARARAAAPPGVEVLAAGVPLFAEAAATQANAEVNTVGSGSLLAILAVMWLAFRSLRPLALVLLSVGMGVGAGLSACVLLFGKVHLITLVFGASLVGVAEDYGLHYFASRQAEPGRPPRELLRRLAPGLFLAMLTSVAGYLMLAIAPFPGLRQVAAFSVVGLAAAFLTVLAWYPALDRRPLEMTRFSAAWAASHGRWPALSTRALALGVAAAAAVTVAGALKLQPQGDLRALQASPRALVAAQQKVSALIGLPSPGQLFLVRGATEAERLEREEALVEKLEALPPSVLSGCDAVSSWVPSPARQRRRQALVRRTRESVLAGLAGELEEAAPRALDTPPLTVAQALATPLQELLRPLWLDEVSVVLLHEPTPEGLPALAALEALPGVHFVDRTGELSGMMLRWQTGMTWLLPLGYAVVFLALLARFGRRAWRALLPTAVAAGLTFAVVGFLGEPLTLFHVLAQWLLLGMGVDYGIFLVEHPEDEGEAWLAIGLGAVSTVLSYGLLALSSTPAIHAFGLTLGLGASLVWLLSPLCARPPRPPGGER